MRLDLDESVEVFSKAPNVDDEDDPGNLGKGKPLPLPQLPLPPTSVGDITAAPSDEIRSSTPSIENFELISYFIFYTLTTNGVKFSKAKIQSKLLIV